MKTKVQSKIDVAWEHFNNNDLDRALKMCTAIIDVKKHALNANYLMGRIFFLKKDLPNALNHFLRAVEFDIERKGAGVIRYWIGRTYEYSQSWSQHDDNPIYDKQKANQAYKEALSFNNFPLDTIYRLATNDKKDFEKQQLYELGIRMFPKEVDLYVHLAKLFRKMGHPLKQLDTLKLGIAAASGSPGLLFNLANYYYGEKDYSNGLKYFNECLKMNGNEGNNPIIYYCIGNCYYNQNNFDEAVSNYKKGLDLTDKNDSNIWYNAMGLIASYNKQRKFDVAVSVLNDISFDRDIFEYLSFDYGVIVYLDGEIAEEVSFQQSGEELISVLSRIRREAKGSLDFKTSLLLSELYGYINDHSNQLKILRACLPYPIGYDFLENKLVEAYCNATNGSYFNTLGDFFVEDLKKDSLSNESEERIAEDLIGKLYAEKQFEKVARICEELTDKQIENAGMIFDYAYSLNEIGKWKEAKSYYEKYLKSHPKSSPALNNLGVIYKEKLELEKATQLFKEAIKYDKEEKELYHNNLKNTIEQLDKRKSEEKERKIPPTWTNPIKNITVQTLDELGYFAIILKIEKINKKYQYLVERDFKELVFNYLVGNYKSTVVLSGSLVEMVLTYYCEKKKISTLQLKDNNGKLYNKKLYDCVLNDLITFVGDKKLFGSDFHHLGNLARVYRNFIHPSLELKSKTEIRPKANLCFISTIEILRKILG
jgi:tetratricopeptide (TPR) repeat protein